MVTDPPRGRLLGATALFLGCGSVMAVVGCSPSSPSRPAGSLPPASSSDPTAGTPNAAKVRDTALAAAKGLRSYAFLTQETLAGGPNPHRSLLSGSATRPDMIRYTLTSDATTSQVVRIGTAGYLKDGTGPWRRAVHPVRSSDPLATLIGVLQAGSQLSVAGSTLQERLTPVAAVRAGLVSKPPAGDVLVTVSLDAASHAIGLRTDVPLLVRGQRLQLTAETTYSGFDRQPAITAPI